MKKFPHYKQLDAMDCGPTCLRMVARYYGKHFSLQTLRDKAHLNKEGVSMLGISRAAESIGLQTMGVSLTWEKLKAEALDSGVSQQTLDKAFAEVKAPLPKVVDQDRTPIQGVKPEVRRRVLGHLSHSGILFPGLLAGGHHPEEYQKAEKCSQKGSHGFLSYRAFQADFQ